MAENSRRRYRQRQQLFEGVGAGFIGKIAAGDIVRIDGYPATTQRLDIALQAIMAQRHLFRAGDTADAAMPQLVQIVNGVKGGGEVIDMHRRQLKLGSEFIGHDHRRQIALLLYARIEGQTGAKQQHTVDLLGNDQVDKGLFLTVLVGAIANQHQVLLFRRGDFNTANDLAEKGVADIRHNHQNGA